MNPARPKAILFDFGGTLDSDGIPWKERFHAIYREEGIDWDLQTFAPLFYASDDSLTKERLNAVGYEAMLFEQVTRVLHHGNHYDAQLCRRIVERFHKESLVCLERNRPLLEKLSSRYRLGIVSNFYGNLGFICEEIGYIKYFRTIIDSARIGVTKPSPAIFEAALEQLDCPPGRAIFVGDHPVRDMQAAKALGMPHIWLNTLDPYQRPCCERDEVIGSLTQLQEILL